MEGGKVFNGSDNMATVLLHHDQSEVPDSLWVYNSSPSFHGSASMANLNEKTKGRAFLPHSDKLEHVNEEDFEGCFHPAEKKRRLSPQQVQFLEKSFEMGNKLEPERKAQLAKEIGLQPRQVAIWFQNRRARYKTKQLERDYDSLKASYDKLKTDYDTLFKENEKLKNEVHSLAKNLLLREDRRVKSEPCDPINTPSAKDPEDRNLEFVSRNLSSVLIGKCRQEDASCAKSDVIDSDSPHYTDGNHSSLLEPADDSSNIFEPDPSDFSQDEDDSLSKRFFHAPSFPKLEVECYGDLQDNPSILGLPIEEQGTWLWNY